MKFNYYLGATVSAWLLTLMVIVADLYTPFKDALKGIFGHHWIGKGVITFAIFILVGFIFSNTQKIGSTPVADAAYKSAWAGFAVILLFYLYEWFT